MSAELNDRGWEALMSGALGLNAAEGGLLADTDSQQNFTGWDSWPEPAKQAGTAPADG